MSSTLLVPDLFLDGLRLLRDGDGRNACGEEDSIDFYQHMTPGVYILSSGDRSRLIFKPSTTEPVGENSLVIRVSQGDVRSFLSIFMCEQSR